MASIAGLGFVLVFPAVAFFAGCYLVYRAMNISRSQGVISGPAKAVAPSPSHITKQNCIYSKTVFEYLDRGASPWRHLFTVETCGPFSAGGRNINPKDADFKVTKKTAFKGHARREKGLIERLGDSISKTSPGRILLDATRATSLVAPEVAPDEFLDDAVYGQMEQRIPRRILEPHKNKAFRITEYAIPEGSVVYVIGGTQSADVISNSPEFPLTISDSMEYDAKSLMSERTYTGLFLGIALISLSVIVMLFLLFGL